MNIEEIVKEWLSNQNVFTGNDEILSENDTGLSELVTDCIKDLNLVEADQLQKKVPLQGIEPSDIVNGSRYVWQTEGRSILVSACLDGLISHHDDDFWPFRDKLAGYLYGPINTK